MQISKIFLLLVGTNTKYLTKFVKWEINLAIKKELPIIVVNLNGKRDVDNNLCPTSLKGTLSVHISFQKEIIQYAIDNWPDSHQQHKRKGETGTYRYRDSVYKSLGL